MIQIISKYYKAILVLAGIALLISLIWVVDVRREHTKDELKDYVDSCNRQREMYLLDIRNQLTLIKTQDSLMSLQKTKLIKNETKIKSLSNSNLHHYIDSISPRRQ